MTGLTHVAVGVTCATLAGASPAGLFAAAVASTAPDLDLLIPGAHRKATHSILAVAAIFIAGTIYFPELAVPFLIGYACHLLFDCFTPAGCPLLWPLPVRFRLPLCSTGSLGDKGIRLLAIAVLFFCLMTRF